MIKTICSWPIGIALLFCFAGFTAQGVLAETYSQSIRAGGRERHFIVTRPDAGAGGRLPAVIALHGPSMSGRTMRQIFGMEDLARREGFAVAYPDGIWWRWNDGRSGESWPDDVGFIRRIADELVRSGVADPERLYLVGISTGGMLAYRVACEAPRLFAAYAAVIANLPAPVASRCAGREGVPMLIINSTNDPVMPWQGGALHGVFREGQVLSARATSEFWRLQNGCSAEAETKPLADKDPRDGSTVLARQYSDCRSGAPLVFMTVEGGGHMPPGIQVGHRPLLSLMLGSLNQDISSADVSWKFFKRFAARR